MNTETTYTAFIGHQQLISDQLLNVALMIKQQGDISTPILIFNDQTGQQIDVNIIGSELDLRQRYGEPDVVKKWDDQSWESSLVKSPCKKNIGIG